MRIIFLSKYSWNFPSFLFGLIRVVEYGKQYNVEVFFPKMEVDGIYDVSGQILLLPIKGHGPFHGTFSKNSIFANLISVKYKLESIFF